MTDNQITTFDVKSLASWRVLQLLITGKASTQAEACDMEGISPQTFMRHMRQYPELTSMFLEYKTSLQTGISTQLEEFMQAETSFVSDLIATMQDPDEMMQNRVMAHNKLLSIFDRVMRMIDNADNRLENTKTDEESAAARLLARSLQGAQLRPAISKVTVEFAQATEAIEGNVKDIEDDTPPDQIR